MYRSSNDLLLVSLIASLAALSAWLGLTWPPVQAVFGLCLVLFAPGYALTAAFFPPRTLGFAERLLFTVALSLISTMLGSLALYWLQVPLRPVTWALLLAAITYYGSLLAWLRRRFIQSAAPALNLSLPQAGILGLAGLAVVAAVSLARVPSGTTGLEGYTVLWILPTNVVDPPGVRIGITSMEFTPARYRLLVTVDGRPMREWDAISLGPGEKWEAVVPLSAQTAGPGKIEATLYRLDNPNVVYRQVSLWQKQVTGG